MSEIKLETVHVTSEGKRQLDGVWTHEISPDVIHIPPSKKTIRELTKILEKELRNER